MKHTILSLFLTGILLGGVQPSIAQILASAQTIPSKEAPNKPVQKQLIEVLHELS